MLKLLIGAVRHLQPHPPPLFYVLHIPFSLALAFNSLGLHERGETPSPYLHLLLPIVLFYSSYHLILKLLNKVVDKYNLADDED